MAKAVTPSRQKLERRVLVVADASYGYDRRVLEGVGHYGRITGHWTFRTFHPTEFDLIQNLLAQWKPTGAISCIRVSANPVFQLLAEHHIPFVQADSCDNPIDSPGVYTERNSIARIVAEHFVGRGLQSFGYVGGSGVADTKLAEYLKSLADEHKFTFARFAGEIRTESDPKREFRHWLGRQKLPLGILAATDWVGWHVISESLEAGFHVPDNIAVVGIGDDLPWCGLAPIPLSSIALASEKIGYQAAAILDRLMAGSTVASIPVVLPPVGLVARQSTDIIAVDEKDMSSVLRYMHDHAADGHGVKEILHRFPIDRRKLERWFRRNLGRSPFEEIQRLRIAQVKRLLSQTEESTEEIVRRCGFSSVKTLSRTFCREVGITLSAYRKQFKRSSMGHE
jgi:LacI family transcriptional regulator